MSKEIQIGKYEFYPYDEKIQRVLDELSAINGEPEKAEEGAKENFEKLLERVKRLKQNKWKP